MYAEWPDDESIHSAGGLPGESGPLEAHTPVEKQVDAAAREVIEQTKQDPHRETKAFGVIREGVHAQSELDQLADELSVEEQWEEANFDIGPSSPDSLSGSDLESLPSILEPSSSMPELPSVESSSSVKMTMTLERTFGFGSMEGKEIAARPNVVQMVSKRYKDNIAHLNSRIAEVEESIEKGHPSLSRDQLLQQKEYLEAKKELALQRFRLAIAGAAEGWNWAASSSYRKTLKAWGEDAEEHYIPALVNTFSEQVMTTDSTDRATSSPTWINRSGAISYYPHGETSLPELKALRQQLTNSQSHVSILEIQRCFPRMSVSEIRQLGRQGVLKALDHAILQRQDALEAQVMLDMAIHCHQMLTQLGGLPDSELLPFIRVSMLDAIKDPKFEKSGFILSERNQLLDMAGIFEVLNSLSGGSRMTFDGTGPYIDEDDLVHMPQFIPEKDGKPAVRPFVAILANISTQGHTQNEGIQASINDIALGQLEKMMLQRTLRTQNKAAELIQDGKSEEAQQLIDDTVQQYEHFERIRGLILGSTESTDTFPVAEKAVEFFAEVGAFISASCFSGKDRTGHLIAVQVLNKLKALLADHLLKQTPPPTDAQIASALAEAEEAFGVMLHAPDGMARTISAMNTGLPVGTLKLMPPDLKGVSFAQRLELYSGAVTGFIAKPGPPAAGAIGY